MFDNVDDRFLPVAEHRPILSFGHPVLHYAHSRESLNAGSELTDATVSRVGPDQVAYIHVGAGGVERWTYGRLQAQVNRVAHGLHTQGVRAGDRVLTRFSEVPQAVIVQLATWKLGAIVVPSAPVEAARELAYMLNDTEAVAIVAESDSATEVEKALADAPSVRTVIGWPGPIGGDGLTLDSVAHAQPDTFEAYPTRPLDASGIYYTGGTTGRPKGCVHTHAGELAVADLSNAARGVTAASVLLTHAPIGHAFGNGERRTSPCGRAHAPCWPPGRRPR